MRKPTAEERQAIGRQLREAREALELRQDDIAGSLRINQAIVSRIEGGKYQRPDPIVLMEYSRKVGLDPMETVAPYFSDYKPVRVAS